MPTLTDHKTSGPFSGHERKIPFCGEVLFLSGPRNCGQSWAKPFAAKANRTRIRDLNLWSWIDLIVLVIRVNYICTKGIFSSSEVLNMFDLIFDQRFKQGLFLEGCHVSWLCVGAYIFPEASDRLPEYPCLPGYLHIPGISQPVGGTGIFYVPLLLHSGFASFRAIKY